MLKLDSSGLSWRSYWAAFTLLTGLHPVLAEAAAYCVCWRLDKTGIISSLTVSEWRAGCCDKQILYYHLCSCWAAVWRMDMKPYSSTIFAQESTIPLSHAISCPLWKPLSLGCLKRNHKVESSWEDGETQDWLQDLADNNREYALFEWRYVYFFYMISSRG